MQKSIASLLDYAEKVWPYRRGSKPPTFHDEPSAPFDKLIQMYDFDDIEQAFADSKSGLTVKPVLRISSL